MLTEKINIAKIKIELLYVTTKRHPKRVRRGGYQLHLSIPVLRFENRIEYLKAALLFRPNKRHLFIEYSFAGADLNACLDRHERVPSSYIKETIQEEIEQLVRLAFKHRVDWKQNKSGAYVYSPLGIGMLCFRLVTEAPELDKRCEKAAP